MGEYGGGVLRSNDNVIVMPCSGNVSPTQMTRLSFGPQTLSNMIEMSGSASLGGKVQ